MERKRAFFSKKARTLVPSIARILLFTNAVFSTIINPLSAMKENAFGCPVREPRGGASAEGQRRAARS